jgi:hypothetical protein
MRMLRPAALALVAVTSLGALTACTSAEPTGDSSSFGEVSGSAVPVADELTALCEQIVAEALPLDAATALAEAGGYRVRVVTLDGEPQAATADARDDRMNLDVEADVVTGCTVG